jgi:hypothetical protein
MVLTLDLVRFRFESFVAAFFILARLVLLVLRATRVFDAGLLLLTRLRTLDEEAPFGVRFDVGFAREAAPVFFVFELVVFFDLLRATIVNLSTRKLFRTRYRSVHNTALDPCTNIPLQNGKLTFRAGNHLRLRQGHRVTSVQRLICRLAQIRRKIKEEDNPERPKPLRRRFRRGPNGGTTGMGLIALPRLRRKKFSKLVSPPVELLAVRRRLFLTGYIRPRLGVFSIQLQPKNEVRLSVRLDCLGRAFRFAHTAIDALVRVNNEHIFALVEAVNGAHLHAIQIFAFYAVFYNHISHACTLMNDLLDSICARLLWISRRSGHTFSPPTPSAAMVAQLRTLVALFLK